MITESITQTQTVSFILDKSEDFSELKNLDLKKYQKAIVFCDEALKDSWWPKLKEVLDANIKIADVEFLEATESVKDLGSYTSLVSHLADNKGTRSDLLIAIGGGTILDVVSFLASTYMRGLPLLMIPSTLIGQADASTAGKTCLNTDYSKNLLGTFYLPAFVYNNVQLLKTNSEYHQRQGFSEIFKYALLGSAELLTLIQNYKETPTDSLMLDILQETIKVRLDIRRKDPLASNFGHTFGHALEKYSNFEVNHGDAISVGMVMDLEFSVQQGLIQTDIKDKIVSLMKSLGLNTHVQSNIDADKLTDLMRTDKKSSGSHIGLVLIQDIAKPLHFKESPFYLAEPKAICEFLKNFLTNKMSSCDNHWNQLKELT